jgi:hypothetical protein
MDRNIRDTEPGRVIPPDAVIQHVRQCLNGAVEVAFFHEVRDVARKDSLDILWIYFLDIRIINDKPVVVPNELVVHRICIYPEADQDH